MRLYFKIVIITFFVLIFYSCDNIPTEVIDSNEFNNFRITQVSAPALFEFTEEDSTLLTTITIENSNNLINVWFDINTFPSENKIAEKVIMYDDGESDSGDRTAGDNIYSGKVDFLSSYSSGNYEINYYVETNSGNILKTANHKFFYDNGEENAAPVISDLVMPDTIVVSDTTVFLITIKAEDENGSDDIESVYFITYRPDGSTSNTKTQLYDSGDTDTHGDAIKNDNIYSRIVLITNSAAKGSWKFEFVAKDKRKKSSNIISKFINIK